MKQSFKALVERRLILKDQARRSKSEIKIMIGLPRWTIRGREAACPVAIEGLVGRVKDIRGIDPMHAVFLALSFADSVIKNLPRTQKVTWPNGEPYDIDVKS